MDTVKNFLNKHDKVGSTEVCTETAAPITQEHVIQHQNIKTAEAIDKEIHQHHHQHRIQPVTATETLATEHKTNIAPEVTRETVNEINPEHKKKLEAQHASIQSSRTAGPTEVKQTHIGATVNEHVHHHVHEHITPLIQKETHAHTVVHNVIPVHEKIHEAPIVHETTTLPTLTLEEFQKAGSQHHGDNTHQHAFYEGVPKTASATGASTSKGANKDFHSQSPTSSTSSDLNHGVQHDGRQTAAGTAGAAAAKKSF